eukprot:6188169-Pleurochrysis_carterae.AAC.1
MKARARGRFDERQCAAAERRAHVIKHDTATLRLVLVIVTCAPASAATAEADSTSSVPTTTASTTNANTSTANSSTANTSTADTTTANTATTTTIILMAFAAVCSPSQSEFVAERRLEAVRRLRHVDWPQELSRNRRDAPERDDNTHLTRWLKHAIVGEERGCGLGDGCHGVLEPSGDHSFVTRCVGSDLRVEKPQAEGTLQHQSGERFDGCSRCVLSSRRQLRFEGGTDGWRWLAGHRACARLFSRVCSPVALARRACVGYRGLRRRGLRRRGERVPQAHARHAAQARRRAPPLLRRRRRAHVRRVLPQQGEQVGAQRSQHVNAQVRAASNGLDSRHQIAYGARARPKLA